MNLFALLHQRVMMLFGLGATTRTADESGGQQKLQIQMLGIGGPNEVHAALPSMQLYGFASSPVPGCYHAAGFMSGDRSKGVAIASNDPRYRPTFLAEGEAVVYDNQGRWVYLSAAGIVINGNGTPVTVQGDLHVTGDIVWNSGGASPTTASTHDHTNGNNGANTGAPVAGS